MSSFERYNDDRDRRPYRSSLKCFNCNEPGHYANQCPHRDRRYSSSRPSTSSDSRRSRSPRKFEAQRNEFSPRKGVELRDQVAELTKGVATIKEHFDLVRAKKEEKARHKLEKERGKEEERLRKEEKEARLAQEEARREAKRLEKEAKAKQEAILKAEMKKDVTMHATMLMSEIKDDWIKQWKTSVLPSLAGDGGDVKGKKQVRYEAKEDSGTGYSSEGSETSVTQEISEKTERLITEKRKRVEDTSIADSPPMETPGKRTPRRECGEQSRRVTRARTKGARTPIPAKKRSPIKTPLPKLTKNRKQSPPSGRLTPASKSLTRLRFRDAVMKELKDCNADELQRYCKKEGILYAGKIDVIFDLVEHRAQVQFPSFVPASEVIRICNSIDEGAVSSTENLE
ncbi:hypothetical protein CBR_g40293 [Chara braunii]|uniref:CCHC-type domain-containing protein n=1 Tax=Chara braunii TaxID=69332 RepID=A0A388K1Y1_CHABU|nr:hypothetical protein CBR_g40293 [Chara braunii]|eukprot:GBG64046.1 hypothetical protein CBR_g40293 [Chara braunii]